MAIDKKQIIYGQYYCNETIATDEFIDFLEELLNRLSEKEKQNSVFVLDNVPNCTKVQIEEREEKFIEILRKSHPKVPIIFVETPDFTDLWLDNKSREEIKAKNDAHRAVYEKLRKAGDKNLYYVPSKGLIGDDGEGTVDGTHFTDLGMLRYAETVAPVIKKAMR